MAAATGKRDYWHIAGFSFLLLLSAGNIADELDGVNRSNLQLVLWCGMAALSLASIVRALRPQPPE